MRVYEHVTRVMVKVALGSSAEITTVYSHKRRYDAEHHV
jgi:hypothetical protein